MKKWLFLLSFLGFSIAHAAKNTKQYAIIRSSAELNTPFDTSIVNITQKILKENSLVVHYRNGQKKEFLYDSLWGYREDSITYHVQNRDKYELLNAENPTLFYRETSSLVAGKLPVHIEYFYISRRLDAPLIDLNKKNIQQLYSANTCLMDRLDKENWYIQFHWGNQKQQALYFVRYVKDYSLSKP